MRVLNINPQKHEFSLSHNQENGEGVASVYFSNFDDSTTLNLTAGEAEKIGKWFLACAKQIKIVSKMKPLGSEE